MKVMSQGYIKLLKQTLLMLIVLAIVAGCSGSADPATPTASPATETPVIVEEPTEETEPTDESAEATQEATEEVEATETEAAATEDAGTDSAESLAGATVQVSFPSSVARSGPATSFEAVREITVNQVFSVVASAGEGSGIWYLVDLGDGTLAWVWARVVTLSPGAQVEAAATIPAP